MQVWRAAADGPQPEALELASNRSFVSRERPPSQSCSAHRMRDDESCILAACRRESQDILCGTETKSEEFGSRGMATRYLKLAPTSGEDRLNVRGFRSWLSNLRHSTTSVEDSSNRCAEQFCPRPLCVWGVG